MLRTTQRPDRLSRRDFIKTSAAMAAAAATLGQDRLSLAAPTSPRCLVAIRDQHLKATGRPDSWSAMKALEVNGVEVVVNEDLRCASLYHPDKRYSLATAEGIQVLKDDLAANGATLAALCMNNRLDEQLARELAWARKLVPAAQKLGVTAIRIDVVPRAIPADQFLPFAIKACKQLCDIAAGTPVRYGIENHGRITNDPGFLEKLFDGVGSPQLGLTFDAMNFYWFGHPLDDLYGIYTKFAGRAVHTHCKNLRYPEDKKNARRPIGWEYDKYSAPVYDGDIDYGRVVEILRKAGYRGDLCLENECLGHFPENQRVDVLKKEIALLKRLA